MANVSTMATAIVTNGYGSFAPAKVELEAPQDGEVLIQLKASGVCHTDLDSLAWKRRLILGHEGAGVVIACGENVPNVRVGDRVLLNWAIPCHNWAYWQEHVSSSQLFFESIFAWPF